MRNNAAKASCHINSPAKTREPDHNLVRGGGGCLGTIGSGADPDVVGNISTNARRLGNVFPVPSGGRGGDVAQLSYEINSAPFPTGAMKAYSPAYPWKWSTRRSCLATIMSSGVETRSGGLTSLDAVLIVCPSPSGGPRDVVSGCADQCRGLVTRTVSCKVVPFGCVFSSVIKLLTDTPLVVAELIVALGQASIWTGEGSLTPSQGEKTSDEGEQEEHVVRST